MLRFTTILLAAILLLPLGATTAEAKVRSSKAQFHVVKQGDTLYEIAQRHGLTVKELKRLNGLGSSRLKIGQKLALDRAVAPPLPQAAKSAPRKAPAAAVADSQAVHVVRKGDSLYSIGRRHGLSAEQLKGLNNLSSNRLRIGQKLVLSGEVSREEIARTEAPKAQGAGKYAAAQQHVVRKGETLSSIARRHHLSVKELKRLNGLRSNQLKIGQRLALSDPYEERNPILLPGDASDDEVIEMATTTDSELEKVAFNYLSTPYRFGGNSRRGIDCSAFVQQVFREMDVNLPRSAREQYRVGVEIDRDDLQKGDLIFFRTYARFPSHVGIYLGDGKMIHASSRSRRVVVTSIDHPYYRKRFIGAKRISLIDDEDALLAAGQTPDGVEDEVEDAAPPVEVAGAAAVPVVVNPEMTSALSGPAPAGAAQPAPTQAAPMSPLPPAAAPQVQGEPVD